MPEKGNLPPGLRLSMLRRKRNGIVPTTRPEY